MVRCTILVGIGANMPGPDGRNALASCEWAVARLGALRGLRLVARSRWYRSTPVPPSGQPDYVNGAACLSGDADPSDLLSQLHGIEDEGGRVRGEINAARTLDLDLLAVDGLMVDGPGLILPHPRLHERGFVLAPLCEVAPGWMHPRLHRSAAELLTLVDRTGIGILAGSSTRP